MTYFTPIPVTLNKDVFDIVKSYLDNDERNYLDGKWDKIYNLTDWAAACNKVDVFQTLLQQCKEIKDASCAVSMAACHGNLEIMKFIRDNTGCLWDKYTYCFAVNPNSNIEILNYMKNNECPWNNYAYINAIKNDKFEFFKWLNVNGCPWNLGTCIEAANLGKLEFLQYARENGCPWNEDVLLYAKQGEHLECVEYCKENNCPTGLDWI